MANGIAKLEDVARLAGVSKSTASRILATPEGDDSPFATQTQSKVRGAAAMLGYRPSKIARGLTQARTGIVGLVMPSVTDSFFPGVTSIIETHLARNGFDVILANTHSDAQTEQAKVEGLLDWRVDGLIVAPAQESGDAGLYWELWRRRVPFVLIDRAYSDTPFHSVTTDDYAGAALVVEHLLSIGRRRIAWAGGSLGVSTNRQRHAGYTQTLTRNGIFADPGLGIEVRPDESGGRQAAGMIARMDPLPDALFCFSDHVAIGAMQECMALGIRIPEDLALVGYADLDHSAILRIPLTTVRQPREELGETAAAMLLDRMLNSCPVIPQVTLPVSLVIRGSTVPPAAADS